MMHNYRAIAGVLILLFAALYIIIVVKQFNEVSYAIRSRRPWRNKIIITLFVAAIELTVMALRFFEILSMPWFLSIMGVCTSYFACSLFWAFRKLHS